MSITLLFILVAACLLFFLAAGFRFCSPLSVGVCLILSTMSDASVRLEVSRIKGQDDLPVPPFPHPPELANNSSTPIRGRLKLIQAYITSLEYNYTGEAFFVKKKDRGFRHVTSTAKLIIREALPIQCVEAVFVGAYLTADMAEVDRYPVCFRSSLDGRVFRHIVLAVRNGSVWGALGLSRRETLMYKDLRYASFSDLIADFRQSYAGSWHRLECVWVGFPLPHDISSNLPVKWKVMSAAVGTDAEWASGAPDLDRFVVCAPALFERFSSTGKIPDHPILLSASAAKFSEDDGADGGEGEGGDDARSPGAPSSSWLGPSGTVGRQRARSTAVVSKTKLTTAVLEHKRGGVVTGDDAADRNIGIGGGSEGGGGGHEIVGTSCGAPHGGVTENCNSNAVTFVSPPRRARARSAGVGEWRGAKRSPDKARRRRISASGASAKATTREPRTSI